MAGKDKQKKEMGEMEILYKILEVGLKKNVFLGFLVVCFVLFIFTKSPILAIVCTLLMLVMVASESLLGVKEHGIKKEIFEIIVALAIAVVFIKGISFLLDTKYPIDSVVSCSMLPNLKRGDFVILKGGSVSTPELNLSEEEIWTIRNGFVSSYANQTYTNFILCAFYNRTQACEFLEAEAQKEHVEEDGIFKFIFKKCVFQKDGRNISMPCLKELEAKGNKVEFSEKTDIFVYEPREGDLFYKMGRGAIIHRAFAKINTEKNTYYLARGDNNGILDLQTGNSLVEKERVHGKVIFRVPYLGYLRLFLAGSFNEQYYCEYQFVE